MRRPLGAVHHTGIACRDIQVTRDQLVAALDVVSVDGPVVDPLQDATLCMLTTRDGARLELVSGAPVDGVVARGGGPYHVCFEVDSIAEAVDELAGAGWRVVAPPTPAVLFDGAPVAFLLSPMGLVELVELPR
jgi:methylmalonyl-CoA/ethylmalonyl-CoA epimerase